MGPLDSEKQAKLTNESPAGSRTVRFVSPASLKEHVQASLVPPMRPAEFDELLSDIASRGIVNPIQVEGNVVVDGRHRLRAAMALSLPVVPVVDAVLSEGENSTDYMIKAALLRRHLTDDQRAIIAARYATHHPLPRGGARRRLQSQLETNLAHGGQIDPTPGRSAAAVLMNVAPSRVKKASSLLHAPELAIAVHHGKLKLSEALRVMRRAKQIRRIDETPLPEGLFRTIVVDPPWEYADATCRGAAENIYPTLGFTEVCRLPIVERAASECHLFLWVTNPHVEAAFEVIRRWGFAYKTLLTWVKPRMGLGRYFRGTTEHILFATRGNLLLREQNIKNCFDAPGGAHSEKPEAFYQIVERACFGPYLELFARRNRPGWICWGAELDGPIHQTGVDVNASEAWGRGEASS